MNTVWRLLEAWTKNPAPGYLFIGAGYSPKREMAERFVVGLLGQAGATLSSAHPDLIILETEEGKTIVSVAAVREARMRLYERPMVAPRQVVFVPHLDRLNEEGMNALLKVLEEPPAGAVFVCLAEDLSRIPATIQSRMVKVPIYAAPPRTQSANPLASRFVSATSVGERLSIIESLAKDCESADNSADAWSAALDEWSEALRRSLSTQTTVALVAGQGVITAKRFIGGGLSPRLPLEAAALKLSGAAPLNGIFPTHLSQSLPRIFA